MTYQPHELFDSTAWYYARYRSSYPHELFDYLRQQCRLDGDQTVLDLGAGTGQVAIPLAPRVRNVIAVDPDAAMLDEGRRLANERQVTNITWLRGDSFRLAELRLPTLDLVTMGAAFHWMDRDGVLQRLDQLVQPAGAVAIISGGASPTAEPCPEWVSVIASIRERFLGRERRAGSATYQHPKERHGAVLARSPFSDVHTGSWTRQVVRDLDSVVGVQFSYSFSAPALLGGQREAFDNEIREALAELSPSGVFAETAVTEVLLAKRPVG